MCLSTASSVVKKETQDSEMAKESLDVNLAIIVTDNDIPILVGECLATDLWAPVFSWKSLTGRAAAVGDILGVGSYLGTWRLDCSDILDITCQISDKRTFVRSVERLTSLQRYIAAESEQETRSQFLGPGPTPQGLVTWLR
jgi:hypothetical protein